MTLQFFDLMFLNKKKFENKFECYGLMFLKLME